MRAATRGTRQADAERFIRALAAQLGVTDAHLQAGYEDVWYYLWRERKLPANVDPFDARLDDEMDRERLRRVFAQGLEAIVGYALPLAPAEGAGSARWRSGPWFLRGERMYLTPGDSPMGFRLPLDSLPWVSAADSSYASEGDPIQRAAAAAVVRRAARSRRAPPAAARPADGPARQNRLAG